MANVQGEGSIKGLPQNKGEGTTIRRFIELLEAANILPAVDLAAIKQQLPEAKRDADAAEIARKLVSQNALTKHQAASLYQQRPKNLGLGEYIFLDRLGTGGSGSVFKAKHRKSGDITAVKVLNVSGARSPDALKRFQREAETAARLNHPNIVRALDTGEAGGQYYTAMEYVEGTDLSTYVKKTGPLPWEQAAQCVVTAARALAYAHEQGIIHRDIKPANLMLCSDGKIKVLDMGLARLQDPAAAGNDQAAEGLTQTGQVMGTVDYMAPEQALHTRLADARADVYGLGCTLYRLVTGDIPYDGDSMVAKILSHRETPIPSMRKKNPKVPNSADIALQKMLAKKPEDRYQTMNELADELERCLHGYDIAPLTPPVNLPPASGSHDPDSRSNNSLTINAGTSLTGMTSGILGKEERLPLRRRTPVWIPVGVVALAVVAVGGIAWVMNSGQLTAHNDPEVERAIPPAEATPTPTPPKPSATMPISLPSGSAPSPVGLASATGSQNQRPTISIQPGVNGGTNNPPSTNLPTPTDDRGVTAYAISKGYNVVIYDHTTNQSREVKTHAEIPQSTFTVMALLTSSANLSVDDILTRVAAARQLSGVSFKGAIVPSGSLRALANFAKMQTAIFNDSSLDDAQLKAIETIGTLRQLELARTRVTSAALDSIIRLTGLLHLNLANVPVNAPDLAKLAALSGLQTLNLENVPLNDEAVATLTGLKNLQSLTIRGTQISPDGRQRLATALPSCRIDPAPGSTTLSLSLPSGASAPVNSGANPPVIGQNPPPSPAIAPGYAGERAFAEWCFQQGYRVSLHIPNVPNFTQNVDSFNEVPPGDFAVIAVYINGSRPITQAVFDKLATAPFLTGIYCYNSIAQADPGVWQNLARFPNLQLLTLGRTQFGDADVAVLRSLPELRMLDMAYTKITDASLDVISTLPKLTNLNLSGVPVTAVGLGKLANMPTLRRLHLGFSPISDAVIPALSNLKSLTSINLSNTQMTPEGKQRLASAIPSCDVFSSTWYTVGLPKPSLDMILAAARGAPPVATPNGTVASTSGLLGTPTQLGAPTPPPAPVQKLAVPTEDKLASSLKLIREELFKDKYAAAKKPEERVSLAAELLSQAATLGDDANGTYAMLREARDMAADGGDITVAYSACDTAGQRFELDALGWLAEACEVSVKKTQARTVSRSMAEGLAIKVEDAVKAQNYAVAERLLDTALAASRKSLDNNLTKQLVERDKLFATQKKQFDEVATARKTLAENADDPAANLILGKFECFVEGKWDEGLPHLAKGGDPILKDIAEKSTGKTSAEWVAAGDLWWTQGEKSPKASQKDFLIAALYFYEKSAFELSGLQKTRIDKRIADARTTLGDAAPPPTFGNSPLPPTPGVVQPPLIANTSGTNAAAAAAGLPPDQQRFISFVFARGGGVSIEAWSIFNGQVSTNSYSTNTCYTDVDISRLTGRIKGGVAGISFYSSRGARLSDEDLRSIASAPWIKRVSIDGMPITNSSMNMIGNMLNLEYLIIANCPQVSDAGIAALGRCNRLTSITLNQTGVTGSGFARLTTVPVSTLYLNQSRLDDAGMAGIASGLPQLRYISFDETNVTEAGLARLAVLQGLETVHAQKTRINGSSFANFASGLSLDYLYLNDTQVNDAALTAIGRMTDLDGLHLENTQVTDAGVAKLAGLNSLNTLYLNGCPRVTDASVATFIRFRNLFTLYLRGTGVTPNGAQAVRAQNTRCNVYN